VLILGWLFGVPVPFMIIWAPSWEWVVLLVRDTRDHVRLEIGHSPHEATPIGFWDVFAATSFRDRNLVAASQAGLVNNLNDGMSWGIFRCSSGHSASAWSGSGFSKLCIRQRGAFSRLRPAP
jgi:hypothetical protein